MPPDCTCLRRLTVTPATMAATLEQPIHAPRERNGSGDAKYRETTAAITTKYAVRHPLGMPAVCATIDRIMDDSGNPCHPVSACPRTKLHPLRALPPSSLYGGSLGFQKSCVQLIGLGLPGDSCCARWCPAGALAWARRSSGASPGRRARRVDFDECPNDEALAATRAPTATSIRLGRSGDGHAVDADLDLVRAVDEDPHGVDRLAQGPEVNRVALTVLAQRRVHVAEEPSV